jgi:hypothetical protein
MDHYARMARKWAAEVEKVIYVANRLLNLVVG